MSNYSVGREEILRRLQEGLEPLEYVYAMWEGGAAAFDRVDAWSDIDLQVVVEDDRIDDVFAEVERLLEEEVSPIDIVHDVPGTTPHEQSQKFYRLRDASPFLMVDISVMTPSTEDKSLAREMHGTPLVHFDKGNWTEAPLADPEGLAKRLATRRDSMRKTFDLFSVLIIKELNRGNDIEAIGFYHGFTLRPLVELLRMKYLPERHGFHTRYIHYDLPKEVQARLHALFFVTDGDDIRRKQADAERWFAVLMRSFPAT